MSKRQMRIVVALDTRMVWGRDLVRGVGDFAAMHGMWDCDFSLTGPCDRKTIQRAAAADGLITDIERKEMARAVERLRIPVVAVGSPLVKKIPRVGVDANLIGEQAAEHFIERGFRRFGYYAGEGPGSWSDRKRVFLMALAQRGFSCDLFCVEGHQPGATWRPNERKILAWVKRLEKPVGIFCAADESARELATICRNDGLKIPEDVAILGMNNDELLCQLGVPRLSSIDIGAKRVGFEAARLLQRLLRGLPAKATLSTFPPLGVVMRDSTNVMAAEGEHIRAAVKYIQEHLSEGISVKQLMQHMRVSRRTLEIAFQSQLGRTIHEEIIRAQVHRAACMLEDGDLPVSTVAEKCGLRSQSHLSILFKKRTGQTPQEYRKVRRKKAF